MIVGANGFLGSNLVEYFVDNKNEILAFSRSNNNILHIIDKIQFSKFSDKFTDEQEKLITDFNPEAVIHLAWAGANNYSDINSISQIHKNIPMSVQLLEIINKLDKKPLFIGTGTIFEHGILNDVVNEESEIRPVNFYGLIKNCFKNISKMYCDQNNIDWTWIRICYIYGPRDVEVRFIPNLIKKLFSNDKSDIVFDSCKINIDYLYISDFCKAIDEIVKKKLTGVYNISSGKQYTMKNIIQIIKNKIDIKKDIIFDSSLDNNRKYASKFLCSTNDKIKKDSNWTDIVSIEEGLDLTIQHYKKKYNNE